MKAKELIESVAIGKSAGRPGVIWNRGVRDDFLKSALKFLAVYDRSSLPKVIDLLVNGRHVLNVDGEAEIGGDITPGLLTRTLEDLYSSIDELKSAVGQISRSGFDESNDRSIEWEAINIEFIKDARKLVFAWKGSFLGEFVEAIERSGDLFVYRSVSELGNTRLATVMRRDQPLSIDAGRRRSNRSFSDDPGQDFYLSPERNGDIISGSLKDLIKDLDNVVMELRF